MRESNCVSHRPSLLAQIEKLKDAQPSENGQPATPGRFRVTGKMNSGEEFVDEFDTVSVHMCALMKAIECSDRISFLFGIFQCLEASH